MLSAIWSRLNADLERSIEIVLESNLDNQIQVNKKALSVAVKSLISDSIRSVTNQETQVFSLEFLQPLVAELKAAVESGNIQKLQDAMNSPGSNLHIALFQVRWEEIILGSGVGESINGVQVLKNNFKSTTKALLEENKDALKDTKQILQDRDGSEYSSRTIEYRSFSDIAHIFK